MKRLRAQESLSVSTDKPTPARPRRCWRRSIAVYVNVNMRAKCSRSPLGDGFASKQVGTQTFERVDLAKHRGDILALLFDDAPTLRQHGQKTPQLGRRIACAVVHAEQLEDLRQRQAKTPAAQDEPEAGAVALYIDASMPGAGRRQQAFVLVEADRARRDSEFAGKIGDAEGFFLTHGAG